MMFGKKIDCKFVSVHVTEQKYSNANNKEL